MVAHAPASKRESAVRPCKDSGACKKTRARKENGNCGNKSGDIRARAC